MRKILAALLQPLVCQLALAESAPSPDNPEQAHADSFKKRFAGDLRHPAESEARLIKWFCDAKYGVFDKNWNHQADLPAVATNYAVDKGFSEFWIDGEVANPAPWFDVQFITKGATIPMPVTSNAHDKP